MEEEIWKQVDSVMDMSSTQRIYQDDQYTCSCGGVKTFQYEFPTCTLCGRVDNCFLSDEPEWICDPNEYDDPSRVGIPVDNVLYSENWGMGTRIVGKSCQKMAKMCLHSSMNHRDRALHYAYNQLDHICKGKLKLNDVIIDCAKIMYKTFNEEKLTRGAVRMGIKANCVLYACNKYGVARTIQEVAQAFEMPVKDISRTNELFRDTTGNDTGKTQSSDIISRLFNNIDFIPHSEKGKIRMKVIKACEDSQKNPLLMGKTPKGIASAVIFKIFEDLKYEVDQAFIAKMCDVSVPTLMKIYRLLKI